jgi:CRISPR-associated protein Cas1
VRNLFRERELRLEHFTTDKGACLLGKAGRERFYSAWESWAPPPRRWLRRRCAALASTLREGGDALLDDAAGSEDVP